jgi:acyl-CoA synthetase (AMP-forming)/AMP-acid ligase II
LHHSPLPTGVEQYIALSIIPMFHIFGLVYNVMQPLTLGVKMVSLPKFDAGHFIALMEAQVDFSIKLTYSLDSQI